MEVLKNNTEKKKRSRPQVGCCGRTRRRFLRCDEQKKEVGRRISLSAADALVAAPPAKACGTGKHNCYAFFFSNSLAQASVSRTVMTISGRVLPSGRSTPISTR